MPFDPLAYPLCFLQPVWLTHSEWMEHLPFGMALVEILRPRLVVELGTFYGVSYCGMCQAIARLGLPARALAVDTWEGDPQSGQFATKVHDRLRAHHDPRYGHFSQLFRGTFDEALPTVADGSIDLLHIDGYHTYEAASHDYATWLPKMSSRGVILFHDIAVRRATFGVWRLWHEIQRRHPTVAFYHQHGLGLAAVGSDCPAALSDLINCPEPRLAAVRRFYANLGRLVRCRYDRNQARRRTTTNRRSGRLVGTMHDLFRQLGRLVTRPRAA